MHGSGSLRSGYADWMILFTAGRAGYFTNRQPSKDVFYPKRFLEFYSFKTSIGFAGAVREPPLQTTS